MSSQEKMDFFELGDKTSLLCADPTDVADVCLFLASPLARYVTGANVLVHGGGELPRYIDAANPNPKP